MLECYEPVVPETIDLKMSVADNADNANAGKDNPANHGKDE